MPHEDGGAYAPVVATVSLGGTLCLDISRKPTAASEADGEEKITKAEPSIDNEMQDARYNLPVRILQEPRSLLITTGEAYRDLMHGISPILVDEDINPDTIANWSLLEEPDKFEQHGGKNTRETRISLTYRDVLKVSSAASRILGGMQK